MKKEGGTIIQEIRRLYGLDKYPTNEFTAALFKDFHKFGGKLLKIAKYEEMQRNGKSLAQDMLDLVAKKDKFQSRLSVLQYALDVYVASGPKAAPPKAETPLVSEPPKTDLRAEFETRERELLEQVTSKLGLLFAVAGVLKHPERIDKSPLSDQAQGSLPNALVKLCQSIIVVPEATEASLATQAQRAATAILHFLQGSSESVDSSPSPSTSTSTSTSISAVRFSELTAFIRNLRDNRLVLEARFRRLPRPTPSIPPGLFLRSPPQSQPTDNSHHPDVESQSQNAKLLEGQKEQEKTSHNPTAAKKAKEPTELCSAIVGTDDMPEEGDTPPDPAQRMPVSLLVADEPQPQPEPQPEHLVETRVEIPPDPAIEVPSKSRIQPPPGVLLVPPAARAMDAAVVDVQEYEEEAFTFVTDKGDDRKRRTDDFYRRGGRYSTRRRGRRGQGRPQIYVRVSRTSQ